jgi:GGDEF domain-containing protein
MKMTTLKNPRILRTITLLITICSLTFPAYAKYSSGTAEPSEPYGHTVIVRVVKVNPDWVPYTDTGGWTQAVTIKESEYLKYFEVAIWEEIASIHLYEFPNDYDGHYGYRGNTTDDENIAYRERFALEVFTGLPGTDYPDERSEFIRNAFYSFIDTICDRYGKSNHGLVYSGHGGPGGALFETSLAPKHAQDLLLYWTTRAGKKLAFIDMGGPCNKGAYTDLSTFCPYCEYYIGSDLNNGGYTFDDWTHEKYLETNPDDRYHDLIADHASLIEVLKQAALLMQRCCRGHDVVGRIGGDEFAVVFWDEPQAKQLGAPAEGTERRSARADHPKEAISIAKRFVRELEKSEFSALGGLGPEGKGVLTISGGLASFPRDGSTAQELFQQADKALLDAKRSGKNRIYLVGKPQSDIDDID